ncbi:MAG: Hsp70 family protein [Planctomycetes bacterium]|nr:Hsp70 family protein [Planctomycetota bacterium]
MLPTHAVGIDLGTTYSCIAYLNEHGEPITIPNKDGELSTPSVVLFEDDHVVVGTEAMRNSIRHPDRVVVHAKRYMNNPGHRWKIAGKSYSPVDISTLILKSMLDSAREKIGAIDRAVITVPAQFSDVQRQATAEAGRRAGLKQVDIINEPVAAALCFVLGTEGIWFTELATAQTIMVVDLGGGTFDLSLVRYQKNEVRVIASGGDLQLGGLDWNRALEVAIGKQFQKEFGVDPMRDRESAQALALEAEQTKRSLSVRPKAALTCAAGGQRKTYQVELEQFERLTHDLVERMEGLTLDLLKENSMGWAKVDVVLTTGGSSRMPMVRSLFKKLSGRTLNTSLSPDQSIAHGATYYAGMLLTNSAFAKSIMNPTAAARLAQFKQQSATARSLGLLIRDAETQTRVPHYILPANTPLPVEVSQIYGTVSDNQRRVHLRIVESGTAADSQFVELGTCQIEPLPENLPEGTEIEVTISYDEQARVHVNAKVLKTGQVAHTEIVRPENLVVKALSEGAADEPDEKGTEVAVKSTPAVKAAPAAQTPPRPSTSAVPSAKATPGLPPSGSVSKISAESPARLKSSTPAPLGPKAVPAPKPVPGARRPGSPLDSSDQPVPLCNKCGEPLDSRGVCPSCKSSGPVKPASKGPAPKPTASQFAGRSTLMKSGSIPVPPLPDDDEIIELGSKPAPPAKRPVPAPPGSGAPKPKVKAPPLPPNAGGPKPGGPKPGTVNKKPRNPQEIGEDEFWDIVDE